MSEWMTGGWGIIDIILLLAAVLLFFKLRSILGQGSRIDSAEGVGQAEEALSRGQPLPNLPEPLTDEQIWERAVKGGHLAEAILKDKAAFLDIMRELRQLDPAFDMGVFLERVSEMYEVVTAAYAKGDLESLKAWLVEPVYQAFETAILERKKEGKELSMALVAFKKVQAEGLYFSAEKIKVAVTFLCEIISALKDRDGKVIEGDPVAVRTVRDHWIFVCDRTREASWIVAETS